METYGEILHKLRLSVRDGSIPESEKSVILRKIDTLQNILWKYAV